MLFGRGLLARSGSRSSLPHLHRLRRRDDIGIGGVAAFGTVFAAVLFSSLARAEPVSEVRVQEQASLDVVVTIKGSAAPTFQIFRLPGQDAFAIELPGADLSRAQQDLAQGGVLLEGAVVDGEARGAPRVTVRFFADVDYDAKTVGSTLVVVFKSLGDKGALKQAWQQRRGAKDAQASAKTELAAAARRLDEQRQSYLAMVKDFEQRRQQEAAALAQVEERVKQARDGLTNLEQRKGDEEKRLAALVKQREAADATVKKSAEESRRAELEHKRILDAVKLAKVDLDKAEAALAKAQDKRALEEAKSDLVRVQKEVAAALQQKAVEERRVSELRASFEQAKRELAAVKSEQQKEQQALLAMRQRAEGEKAQAASTVEETKRLEHQLASTKQQQSFEQQRLDDMRAEVRRVAEEAASVKQRAAKEESRVAALQRSVVEQQHALAQMAQQRQQMEQRLATLVQQSRSAEARAESAEQQARVALARADVPRASQRPREPSRAQAPRTAPRAGGRIEMASAEPSAVYGFGGKSIDLATSGGSNRYEESDGYDDESESEGLLSHVTVQRGHGNDSRVGVRVDGGARYIVERTSARQVVLTLLGTRAANLDVRRILDARDLGTSVLRVLPRVLEGGDNRIELTIELRESAPVRVAKDDAMLWVHVGS